MMNTHIKHIVETFDFNSVKNQQVSDFDFAKKSLDLVDLGLPSKTLWCKYNLGVNPRELSKPSDWYGNYYAWGDPTPNKPEYDWNSYKHTISHTILTGLKLGKYYTVPQYDHNDRPDNITKLLPEDDAAYLSNKIFHTPSKKQFDELLVYTTIKRHKNYNGVVGLNGISFVGENGQEIFFPFCGRYAHYGKKPLSLVGTHGYYWSANIDMVGPTYAFELTMGEGVETSVESEERRMGFTIRAVAN